MRLFAEVVYEWRLFLLTREWMQDRRVEWLAAARDVPARERLLVKLLPFLPVWVPGASLVALWASSARFRDAVLVAFDEGRVVFSTLVILAGVSGMCLWELLRVGRNSNIETLFRFASTSETNFLKMRTILGKPKNLQSLIPGLTEAYFSKGPVAGLQTFEAYGDALPFWKVTGVTRKLIDLSIPWENPIRLEFQGTVFNDLSHPQFVHAAPLNIRKAIELKNKEAPWFSLKLDRKNDFGTIQLDGKVDRSGDNLCLIDLDRVDGEVHLNAQTATYGEIMDTGDCLLSEALVCAYLLQLGGSLSLYSWPLLRKMPWRKKLFKAAGWDVQKMLFRPGVRAAGFGVASATTFDRLVSDNYEGLSAASAAALHERGVSVGKTKRVLLHQTRSDDVGTYQGFKHVVPAGMFAKPKGSDEVDILHILGKEFLEELFNVREAQEDQDHAGIKATVQQGVRDIVGTGPLQWNPRLEFTGLVFDMVNLRPELCFHWHWGSVFWEKVFGKVEAKARPKYTKVSQLTVPYKEFALAKPADRAALAEQAEQDFSMQMNYETKTVGHLSEPVGDRQALLQDWTPSGAAAVYLALIDDERIGSDPSSS